MEIPLLQWILEWIRQHPDIILTFILAEHLGLLLGAYIASKIRLAGK